MLVHCTGESVKVSNCCNRRPTQDNEPRVIWKQLGSAQVPTVHRKRPDDLLLSSIPLQSLKTVMDVSLNTLLPHQTLFPFFLRPPSLSLVSPFPSLPLFCAVSTPLSLFVPSPLLVVPPAFFQTDEEEEEGERWRGRVEVKWRRRFLPEQSEPPPTPPLLLLPPHSSSFICSSDTVAGFGPDCRNISSNGGEQDSRYENRRGRGVV